MRKRTKSRVIACLSANESKSARDTGKSKRQPRCALFGAVALGIISIASNAMGVSVLRIVVLCALDCRADMLVANHEESPFYCVAVDVGVFVQHLIRVGIYKYLSIAHISSVQ